MEEKNYVLEIFKQDKIKEMILDFRKHFPSYSNSYFYNFDMTIKQNCLKLHVQDREYKLIKIYNITDYACDQEYKSSYITDVDNQEVKKWYLRYMNKTFDTFKEDYTNHTLKKVNEDLGI